MPAFMDDDDIDLAMALETPVASPSPVMPFPASQQHSAYAASGNAASTTGVFSNGGASQKTQQHAAAGRGRQRFGATVVVADSVGAVPLLSRRSLEVERRMHELEQTLRRLREEEAKLMEMERTHPQQAPR